MLVKHIHAKNSTSHNNIYLVLASTMWKIPEIENEYTNIASLIHFNFQGIIIFFCQDYTI